MMREPVSGEQSLLSGVAAVLGFDPLDQSTIDIVINRPRNPRWCLRLRFLDYAPKGQSHAGPGKLS
jgi:hypothetical protein